MLDFRRPKRARNYLGRGEQLRLLGLVMASGLVALVAQGALNPGRLGLGRRLVGPREAAPVAGIDTRLERVRPRAAADAVTILADRDAVPDPAKRLFPGVDAAWLAEVEDDRPHRGAEGPAFFGLLDILARTDQETLTAASTGPAAFLQLFDQPRTYRGELVTLHGTVRQALYTRASPNDRGIEGFYRLILQPAEAPSELMFVYCLTLPEGFPTGDAVRADVELTGFAYKRFPYDAQDAIRTAPLVLAKTVSWIRAAPPGAAEPVDWLPMVSIAAAASAIVLALIFWKTRRDDRAMRRSRRDERSDGAARDWQRIEVPDPVTLDDIAEQALQRSANSAPGDDPR